MQPAPRQWYFGAVIYQVYVRSFCDSNGEGQGYASDITIEAQKYGLVNKIISAAREV